MTVDAIIFDFDGVIIDTETPDFEVWQEFYREHGLDLSAELWLTRVGSVNGTGFDPAAHFEKLTGAHLDSTFIKEHFDSYVQRCGQQPVLPGVKELLTMASEKGIKLAIASNSYLDWVERWLRQHTLYKYFDCICTRGDVKQGKPAPDLYLKAAECLNTSVDCCVAIEDSPFGMEAALAAGIRCIAVPNELTKYLERPNVALTINSLAEYDLAGLLAKF